LLFVLPWAATVFLLWAEAGQTGAIISRRAMSLSWALLALLAFYAIASTQDYWAIGRARVIAANRLISAGIPRTSIDAGQEYNGWTELEVSGHMNSHWVVNPPNAYDPKLSGTPSILPTFKLEYESTTETVPTQFGSVPYFSILPPFHKQVSIDRVLKPQASP
jgi:hypothetical protein